MRHTEHGVKLNIGGGFTYCEGFTNVDICRDYALAWFPWPVLLYALSGTRKHHPYSAYEKVMRSRPIRHDVRRPLPFPDDSVDEIYTSHLLEHLTHEEGSWFLASMDRVIKPGGTIRIVTPPWGVDREIVFNEHTDEWSRHKWLWTYEEIAEFFDNAELCSYHTGNSTALSLDSMPEQSIYVEVRK